MKFFCRILWLPYFSLGLWLVRKAFMMGKERDWLIDDSILFAPYLFLFSLLVALWYALSRSGGLTRMELSILRWWFSIILISYCLAFFFASIFLCYEFWQTRRFANDVALSIESYEEKNGFYPDSLDTIKLLDVRLATNQGWKAIELEYHPGRISYHFSGICYVYHFSSHKWEEVD